MISAFLTTWAWKMVLYAVGLLVLAWRLSTWKGRARRAEAQLGALQDQVAAATADSAQVRWKMGAALRTAETERLRLQSKLAALRPPEDSQAAMDWLKTEGHAE